MSVNTQASIEVCQSSQEAIDRGFNYANNPEFKSINIEKVVVVKGGTVQGNSTVDFILVDPTTGQKHVFMITSALLNSISSM